jgi:hypothetical protein
MINFWSNGYAHSYFDHYTKQNKRKLVILQVSINVFLLKVPGVLFVFLIRLYTKWDIVPKMSSRTR